MSGTGKWTFSALRSTSCVYGSKTLRRVTEFFGITHLFGMITRFRTITYTTDSV
jgi:hypothetical protein